jgi:hypothetical protein
VLQPRPLTESVTVTASRGATGVDTAASSTIVSSAELLTSAAGAIDDAAAWGVLVAGILEFLLVAGDAGIAGVPLQNGLYAAAAGALIYALFCTSRQISTIIT